MIRLFKYFVLSTFILVGILIILFSAHHAYTHVLDSTQKGLLIFISIAGVIIIHGYGGILYRECKALDELEETIESINKPNNIL